MSRYAYETVEQDGLIVQVVPDSDPMSPREWDNLSVIYGDHRRYIIGDGKPPSSHERALERGGIYLLYRYLRRCGDPETGSPVLAFTKLGMYDHSGVTYYPVPIDPPSRGTHPMDFGGWDSGIVGYAFVTKARADEMGAPYDSLDRQLKDEIKEYGDWASGNVWGYVITKPHDAPEHEDEEPERVVECPHSEEIESIFGYIGYPKYALGEGLAAAHTIATSQQGA